MFRLHFQKLLLAGLALAICAGTAQASLTATPTSVTLTCNATTGVPAAGTVGIYLSAAGSVTVTPSFPGGSPLAAAPAGATVAGTTSGTATSFSFSMQNNCAGAWNGQVVVITFTPSTGTAITVNATLSITGASLVAAPITLNCDTSSGPIAGQVAVTLKQPTGAYTVTPTFPNGSPLAAAPAAQTVNSTTVPVNFNFTISTCAAASSVPSVTLTFTPTAVSGTTTLTGTPLTVVATLNVYTPTIHAASSTVTLYCDTLLGPTNANINITSIAATNHAQATASAPIVIGTSAKTAVNSSTVTPFMVHLAAGCAGVTNGSTGTITFTPDTPGPVLTVTATYVMTSNGNPLTVSPSPVIVTCTKAGTVYTPNATTVNVSSPANYGTPFTLGTSVTKPAYLLVTGFGTASAAPVGLNVTLNPTCGSLPVGTTYTSFSLALPTSTPQGPEVVVPVTVQVGSAATVTATPVTLTYTLGSTTYTPQSSTLTGTGGVFWTVYTTTLPLWLNVAAGSGSLPTNPSFLPTAGANTLALGTYTATVHLKISGALDTLVPVTLHVKSAASSIVISEPALQTTSWILGAPLPSFTITPISSGDAPIPYTVTHTGTTGSPVDPQPSMNSGVAYSFGPALVISFPQATFSTAGPGTVLTGTVTLTWGGGTATETFVITVVSPAATITSITPGSVPNATTGTFTVVLGGTGFVTGTTLATQVGVVNGAIIVPDSHIAVNVSNSTTIVLTITVPTNDALLPFSGGNGTVNLGVCNPDPVTLSCFQWTSTKILNIGINPIISTVTSAASFLEATPPALPAVAPYDMLSIFGTNFCVSSATGCVAPNPAIMYGVKDPVMLRYLTQLTPDTGSTIRNLTVGFYTHDNSKTLIGMAPLLFATNSQINLLVPDAVKSYIGSTVDIVVSFGYGNPPVATMLTSLPYSVTIANTDPGIFAMSDDGLGDAAVLSNVDWSLIGNTNPAGSQVASSDTIHLYGTGLGRPDADGTLAQISSSCMLTDAYWAADNTANAAAITAATVSALTASVANDGLVMQSSLYGTGIQPCLNYNSPNLPTVTVGGASGTVIFSGWVTGSVAGLYQIDVTLPLSGATFHDGTGSVVTLNGTPKSLPIKITSNGKTSQSSGVNLSMVLSPTVVVTPQAFTIASGLLSTTPAPQPFAVTNGSGTTFSVTATGAGALPPGLTMASDGSLAGTPAAGSAGTYNVVVNVLDGSGWKGTAALTITIS